MAGPDTNIASLWLDIEPSTISPPTVTRDQVLPFTSLSWENFERLCYRLAHQGGDVEDARIYGERGQAQEGIDVLVRRGTGDYVTWQCKRYQEVTTLNLEDAVTKFLGGDWVKRTKLFRLAVASSLNNTRLVEEIEIQRARLAAEGVSFEPLDQHNLSVMLKEHPKLVDDFFGRAWVEAFCGSGATHILSRRKLTREQKIAARRFIRKLYAAQFQTVDGGIPAAAAVFRAAVKRVPVFDRYVEPMVQLVESVVSPQASLTPTKDGQATPTGNQVGFRRRDVRTKLSLSAALAEGERFILLGRAGFGKSAALRVLIHSLLGEEARFPALAKAWGDRLPLLVPFGFLTRHFANGTAPTIEGALTDWVKVLGAKDDGLALLREMLDDDRLLLLVDGLDEWQNREAAVATLTALTTFVQARGLPIVATARPLGFGRISDFGPEWKRADLEPLTVAQQREFAGHWFQHFHEANGLVLTALTDAAKRDGEDFGRELAESPVRAELAGIPLLLSVLVFLRISGRVLPRSRLAALEELIKALLEDQPSRRAQSAMQPVDQATNRSPRIRRGLEFLAYCIHQEPNSLVLPNERAADLLRDFYRKELELSASEADDWSSRVIELGQTELGILVAPQENHVGLLHRVFQEYLAAKYLSRVPFAEAHKFCAEHGCKGPWHDVTLILLQLLERSNDVNLLIDEIAKPTSDPLDEPGQRILLARVAAADTNCSRGKATEVATRVFDWIEFGRWLPLRLTLVREIAAGLESEQIGELVAARTHRWFPGRVKWLHDLPLAAIKLPTPETVSDLRIAFHNVDSSRDFRMVAEALAACAAQTPALADEFLGILRNGADPELMAGSLHALALGWPDHVALPDLLAAATVSPAKELQRVAFLIRFKRGDLSAPVRDALIGFCREGQWPYPWEDDIIDALVTGWPREAKLKQSAIARIRGIGHPGSWAPKPAVAYLLRAYSGDDDVARLIAEELAHDRSTHYRVFNISDAHDALMAGFKGHPILQAPAEAWLANPKNTRYSPMDVAVVAQLGGTPRCREALLDYLRRNEGHPAWIISTLLKWGGPEAADFKAALEGYIKDDDCRSDAVRWLELAVKDQKELGVMLRAALAGKDINASHQALEILVRREGVNGPGIWAEVERQLNNDKRGHYWRLGHRLVLEYWPQHPLVRALVRETVYTSDIWLPKLYEIYGADAEIRPLLDATLRVLHEDLRTELVRAVEPLARRGVASAVGLVSGFPYEPQPEARTVAAKACARAHVRSGANADKLTATLVDDLTESLIPMDEAKQAAVAGLLELGRADLVIAQREDNRPVEISTQAGGSHNWDLVASVVEHWEALAAAASDIWDRFRQSPILAAELAKAGKGAAAKSQTAGFEAAIRDGKQVDVEDVRALIALHGRSTFLQDLFVTRLQWFTSGNPNSMMVIEGAAYHAMGAYLADHFHGDLNILSAIQKVAASPMIGDVGQTALCRGWPMAPEIIAAVAMLPQLLEGPEPLTAWLCATKADAALMAEYVLNYPRKIGPDHFSNWRTGVPAIRTRLATDRTCREAVFSGLKDMTDPNAVVVIVRLLARTMQEERAFHEWVSAQITATRAAGRPIAPLAFDVLGNRCKPLEQAFFEAVLTREQTS